MNKYWIGFILRLLLGGLIAHTYLDRYPLMVFLLVGSYWFMAVNVLLAGLDQIDREKFE